LRLRRLPCRKNSAGVRLRTHFEKQRIILFGKNLLFMTVLILLFIPFHCFSAWFLRRRIAENVFTAGQAAQAQGQTSLQG
jgi:cell division protein FtsX